MPIAIPDNPPSVLCLSAADATGGGGLAADMLTLASMGCHPLPVQTAALVRDTRGIDDVWPTEPELLVTQARAILEDVPVAAFKLGFCGSVENIALIAEILSDYPDVPMVVEPVLHAAVLLGDAGEEIAPALADLILPQCTLLVGGYHDLWVLAGMADEEPRAEQYDEEAAFDEAIAELVGDEVLARLLGSGTEFVLLTGSAAHGPQVVNTLFGHEGVVRTDAWPRLPGPFLGAGATLAAAAAAALAHGMELPEAVREAQEFTQQSLRHAYRVGMGRALPDRFFWARGRAGDDV
ncbi:bifunctional hydroxymethylpyrimidine kinase/phosphomethylpyrimidine kinase [Thauera sp. WH-1]|uniref:bifunctional hydroxymethylpyrimidine kinase/phosphomethylpyrimidine kinase n=1 Tax=Thauera sp. WH-1 TaxID=3398230 RepID=UPI0039FD1363